MTESHPTIQLADFCFLDIVGSNYMQQLVIAYLDVKHTLALYCKPEALTSVHTLNT